MADLLVRSGVAVRYVEPLTVEEAAAMGADPSMKKLSPLSAQYHSLQDELRSAGIQIVVKPAPTKQ
jgi:hypothetical protein